MVNFDVIYSQILTSIPEIGESWKHLTKEEFEQEINNLLIPAIAKFSFPQIPLTYEFVALDEENPEVLTGRFVEDITQREINVILALLRVEWMQSIVNKESHYDRYYYDANMRTHSQGNLLLQMNRRMEELKKEAKEAIFNYSRANADGSVNVDRFKW